MILVAGVAELYQGDLDLGRVAVERLSGEDLGPEVLVEELSYGAVAVSQRLEDLRPDAMVIVAAQRRGRAPGTVQRREIGPVDLSVDDLQLAVGDAITGYVTVDLLIEVGSALGTLPGRVVAIEVEPLSTEPTDELTPGARAALDQALAMVRDEVAALRATGGAQAS